ncbi:pseudouridine synthase [Actinobacillus equuli]|nr:pseudouridine synthase [Actinobacillus equuli]
MYRKSGEIHISDARESDNLRNFNDNISKKQTDKRSTSFKHSQGEKRFDKRSGDKRPSSRKFDEQSERRARPTSKPLVKNQ